MVAVSLLDDDVSGRPTIVCTHSAKGSSDTTATGSDTTGYETMVHTCRATLPVLSGSC